MPTSYETSQVNPVLQQFAVDWVGQSMDEFVAASVAPIVPVGIDRAHFPVFNQWDSMNPDAVRPRAKCAESDGQVHSFSEDTYQTVPYDHHSDISYSDLSAVAKRNGMPDFERHTTHAMMRNAMLKWESLFATLAFDTGTWGAGSTYTGVASGPTGNQFIRFDESGSNCINTFMLAIDVVFQRTGLRPTDIILTPDLTRYLLAKDTKLDGRISGIQKERTLSDLASIFGVKRCHRMSASKLSSNVGQATKTFADLASNKAVILFADQSGSEYAPAAIRTFGLDDGVYQRGIYASKIDDPKRRCVRYEGGLNVDVQLTSAYLGVILDSCLTTP